jgi:polysaccharide biosynthesis protein PslH
MVLQTFDESWMVTRADAEGARALAPGVRTRLVPNVVDVAARPVVAPTGSHDVLLVADYRYEPNRAGLAFLAGEAMPRLWEAMPDARLVLAGRGLDEPPADPRVVYRGFVDDLDAVYASAGAAAVPMPRGGGSPLKLIEALARGLPVVATEHAARLVEDAIPGEHLLAAADPDSFARELARALRGDAAAVAHAGRHLAESSYSIEALARELTP